MNLMIARTNFDIVTVSQLAMYDEPIQSILQRSMIPDLLNSTISRRRKHYLRKLNNRTQFLLGNFFEIGRNISEGLDVESLNYTAATVKLPLVLLDIKLYVEVLADALTLFLIQL